MYLFGFQVPEAEHPHRSIAGGPGRGPCYKSASRLPAAVRAGALSATWK